MSTISITAAKKNSTDALIDGLFGGILGGIGMLVFLLATGLVTGANFVETLNRFGIPAQTPTPLSSALLHLGISAVYGAIFAITVHLVRRKFLQRIPWWALGVGYGLLLWLFAASLLLPTTGSALLEFPTWQFASAHLIYGAILSWFCGRSPH